MIKKLLTWRGVTFLIFRMPLSLKPAAEVTPHSEWPSGKWSDLRKSLPRSALLLPRQRAPTTRFTAPRLSGPADDVPV